MCELSIIVPVYNIERIKINCVKQLMNLNIENYEIIFVNDGSTDSTKEVLEEIYKNNPKIVRIINKVHTGVADTRNVGIEKSLGKYIQFVDYDDYIEEDFLKTIKKYMEKNIEIIKYKLKLVNIKEKTEKKVDGSVFLEEKTGEEAFNILYKSDVLLDSPCVYLFLKDLFVRNNLRFENNTEHEDFGLIPIVILHAKSVVSLPIYGYNYIQSEDSITRNLNTERLKKQTRDVFKHYDNMLIQIEKMKLNEITKQNVRLYYTNAIICKIKNIKEKHLKEFLIEFKNRKMGKNIKVRNIKQLIKRILIDIDLKWYLKYY
ncbi:MAG TPA: glycosyltransferase [Clostridia bacterium]|nr:glycosyltransferase [Clostridia bacterium]